MVAMKSWRRSDRKAKIGGIKELAGLGHVYDRCGSLKIVFLGLIVLYCLLWIVVHVSSEDYAGVGEEVNGRGIVGVDRSTALLPDIGVERFSFVVGDVNQSELEVNNASHVPEQLHPLLRVMNNYSIPKNDPTAVAAKNRQVTVRAHERVGNALSSETGVQSELEVNNASHVSEQLHSALRVMTNYSISKNDPSPLAANNRQVAARDTGVLLNSTSLKPHRPSCVPWKRQYPKEGEFAHWLDELYIDLADFVLLTENIRSKDALWRKVVGDGPPVGQRKRALVFCGWVAFWDMEKAAIKGGPSGEFVIWGDLLAGLSALGYRLTVVDKIVDMWLYLKADPTYFDIIITDYDGLGTAENIGHFPPEHCRYFVVDGFGTQEAFNMKRHIDLKRVLVPYEFDGSNSVIHMVTAQLPPDRWASERSKDAVIWAKDGKYLASLSSALSAIPQSVKLYTTLRTDQKKSGPLPMKNVVNLGYKKKPQFLELLTQHRFLIGVGNPLDGPTPLEAIAHGCAYINPLFTPPKVFTGKPTRFAYTSQHPFIQEHIGPPHAYTIDINNATQLAGTVQQILANPIEPLVHKHHRPDGYVANLREIVESAHRNCPITKMPVRHPGNRVFESFGAFARANCGGRCQRTDWVLVTGKSVALASKLLEFPEVVMDFPKYWPVDGKRPRRCSDAT